jgi:hypothetical protein
MIVLAVAVSMFMFVMWAIFKVGADADK